MNIKMRNLPGPRRYVGEYCIQREDTVRERRESYSGFCCRLYPFILLDNNKERTRKSI
jgi:hypothetical protein